MPDERHESADLRDYEVLDASDTLDGAPGDDPLDRGVATPERWSAGMKFGSTAEEQRDGESLDQLLAEEEPDEAPFGSVDQFESGELDENATEDEVGQFLLDQGPAPRAGRLVPEDDADDYLPDGSDLIARDAGINGGGASAEEAAVHLVADDEPDAE